MLDINRIRAITDSTNSWTVEEIINCIITAANKGLYETSVNTIDSTNAVKSRLAKYLSEDLINKFKEAGFKVSIKEEQYSGVKINTVTFSWRKED